MQRLVVENFGPIQYADIELRPLTVFIGEQATGKSTLAKLVYFFQKEVHPLIIASLYEESENEEPRNVIEVFHKKVEPLYQLYFRNQTGYAVSYEYSNGIRVSVSEEHKIEISEKLTDIIKRAQEQWKNKRHYEIDRGDDIMLTAIAEERYRIAEELIQNIGNIYPGTTYIPAGRLLATLPGKEALENYEVLVQRRDADALLRKRYMEFVEELVKGRFSDSFDTMLYKHFKRPKGPEAKAGETIIQLSGNIIKGKYKREHEIEKLIFGDKETDFVLLPEASSGQQSVIRILQDLFLL